MNFRKLALAATAFGLMAGGASAQAVTEGGSVLERVLGIVTAADGTTGSIFANIASTNVAIAESTGAIDELVGNIDGSVSITLNNVGADINGNLTNVNEEITQDAVNNTTDTLRQEIDAITSDLGAISTTVLGAVNTGDMDLTGSPTSVTETLATQVNNAVAGLSTAMSDVNDSTYVLTTGVLGDAQNAVQMLNIADNVASVTGSVTVATDSVNLTTASIGTTVLGAVNTGTITQNAATNVAGVVSSIVGR